MLAQPTDILKFVHIMPGMRAADFGAGSGAFTYALMDRIGEEGEVYALDALPQSVQQIRQEALRAGKRCMTVCTEFENDLPMRENLLDLAVVVNTLHSIDPHARSSFASELARVVVPGGQVLVVDWAGSFKNMGPPSSLVVTPADAVRLFRSAGFTTGDMLPAGTHQYAFVAVLPQQS